MDTLTPIHTPSLKWNNEKRIFTASRIVRVHPQEQDEELAGDTPRLVKSVSYLTHLASAAPIYWLVSGTVTPYLILIASVGRMGPVLTCTTQGFKLIPELTQGLTPCSDPDVHVRLRARSIALHLWSRHWCRRLAKPHESLLLYI